MSSFKNNLPIHTLSSIPGVVIWYCRIPMILQSILSDGRPSHFKPPRNERFDKNGFTQPIFNQDEIDTINGFKALKKQIEWISGRYLIKRMMQHLFLKDTCLDAITLSYLDEGAPFLTHHPDIPVSLSHSNDYTAVACSKNKQQTIGIDIEKIAKKPDVYFLKTAFTHDEILNLTDDAAQIFKNWTIKEAYLKYIKRGFNESLHRVEVINNEIRHNDTTVDVAISSTFFDGYVVSLVSD
jgi:4'-phosphopantetheinyl transferase